MGEASTSAAIIPPVELHKWRLQISQKSCAWSQCLSMLKQRVAVVEFLWNRTRLGPPLETWPDQFKLTIASFVHESSDSLNVCVSRTRQGLFNMVNDALSPYDGPTISQEAFDFVVPKNIIEHAIRSFSYRVNYGLTIPDTSEAPKSLCLWRWEVDEAFYPSEIRTHLLKRRFERQQCGMVIHAILEKLEPETRSQLLAGEKPSNAPDHLTAELIYPVSDTPSSTPQSGFIPPPNLPFIVSKGAALPQVHAGLEKKPTSFLPSPASTVAPFPSSPLPGSSPEGKSPAKSNDAMFGDDVFLSQSSQPQPSVEPHTPQMSPGKRASDSPSASENKKLRTNEAPPHEFKSISSFFRPKVVTESAQPSEALSEFDREFGNYRKKPDVTIAPSHRFSEKIRAFSSEKIQSSSDLSRESLLSDFQSRAGHNRVYTNRRRQAHIPSLVQSISHAFLTKNKRDEEKYMAILQDRARVPVKLFRYWENFRKGYVGTWSKTASTISPRNPFKKDQSLLLYDYDSQDEWDDGEELNSDSDDSESVQSSATELSDDFLQSDSDVDFEEGYGGADERPKNRHRRARKPVIALQPVVYGIISDEVPPEFRHLQVRRVFCSEPSSSPIDPFSDDEFEVWKPLVDRTSTASTKEENLALPPALLDLFNSIVPGSLRSKVYLIDELYERGDKVFTKGHIGQVFKHLAYRKGNSSPWSIKGASPAIVVPDDKSQAKDSATTDRDDMTQASVKNESLPLPPAPEADHSPEDALPSNQTTLPLCLLAPGKKSVSAMQPTRPGLSANQSMLGHYLALSMTTVPTGMSRLNAISP